MKENGFSYELFEPSNNGDGYPESGVMNRSDDEPIDLTKDKTVLNSHRVDVKILGANTSAEIIGQNATGAQFNFYTSGLAESGITSVQSFYQVTYKNIYDGIDLVFYSPDEENDGDL